MSYQKTEIVDLKHHLSEALRYLEGIETTAFPGLDDGVIEVKLAQQSLDKLIDLLAEKVIEQVANDDGFTIDLNEAKKLLLGESINE